MQLFHSVLGQHANTVDSPSLSYLNSMELETFMSSISLYIVIIYMSRCALVASFEIILKKP